MRFDRPPVSDIAQDADDLKPAHQDSHLVSGTEHARGAPREATGSGVSGDDISSATSKRPARQAKRGRPHQSIARSPMLKILEPGAWSAPCHHQTRASPNRWGPMGNMHPTRVLGACKDHRAGRDLCHAVEQPKHVVLHGLHAPDRNPGSLPTPHLLPSSLLLTRP